MRKRESGQLMVLAAMGMAVFMGFAALAVDLGYAYSERRTSQNAADAAALAGIQKVRNADSTTTRNQIHTEILRVAGLNGGATVIGDQFVDQNGDVISSVSSYPLSDQFKSVYGIRVSTQKTFNTYFARAIGRATVTVSGLATAMSMEAKEETVTGLRPIAVPAENYVVGTSYDIWAKEDNTPDGPGSYGWVDLDAGGGSDVNRWINYGFPSFPGEEFGYYSNGDPSTGSTNGAQLPIPTWLNTQTGVDSNALHTTESVLVGQIIYILLYGPGDGTNGETGTNLRYHIVGVAAYKVTAVITEPPGSKKVVGEFVSSSTAAEAFPKYYSNATLTTPRLVPNDVPPPVPTFTPVPTPTPVPPTATATPIVGPATPTPTVVPTATATPVPPSEWPTNFRGTIHVSATRIKLEWDAVPGATSYEIERRSTDPIAAFAPISVSPATSSDRDDTTIVKAGTELYYYHIRAVNGGGASAWSGEIGPFDT